MKNKYVPIANMVHEVVMLQTYDNLDKVKNNTWIRIHKNLLFLVEVFVKDILDTVEDSVKEDLALSITGRRLS